MEGKVEEVVELMEERRLEVLGVCETRLKGQGIKVVHGDYQMIFKRRDDERKYGVALVVSPVMASRVERVEYVNERMMAVVFKMKDRRICLIQVFAPHQGRPLQIGRASCRERVSSPV